jgi:hypothetical protein
MDGAVTLVGLAGWAGNRAWPARVYWILAALTAGHVGLLVISLQIVLKPH